MSLVRAGYARTGINQIRSSKKNTGRKVPVGDLVSLYGAARTSYTPGDFVPTKFNIGHANGSAPAHVSFKNFMLFNTQLSREDQLFNQKMLEHGVFDLSKYRGNPIALIDFSKPDALLAA